jgi:hypothetical protein
MDDCPSPDQPSDISPRLHLALEVGDGRHHGGSQPDDVERRLPPGFPTLLTYALVDPVQLLAGDRAVRVVVGRLGLPCLQPCDLLQDARDLLVVLGHEQFEVVRALEPLGDQVRDVEVQKLLATPHVLSCVTEVELLLLSVLRITPEAYVLPRDLAVQLLVRMTAQVSDLSLHAPPQVAHRQGPGALRLAVRDVTTKIIDQLPDETWVYRATAKARPWARRALTSTSGGAAAGRRGQVGISNTRSAHGG